MNDDSRTDGLADLINLLAAPIATGWRAADQFKRGFDELFRAVENLNRTLENLNDAAERVNRLLADVEEPIRAMVPQLTRTIRVADEISQRVEAPLRASGPNLERLLGNLGPLANLAESAGSLFGGFKVPGVPSVVKSTQPTATTQGAGSQARPVVAEPVAKKPAAKKPAAKKPAAKKPAAKKPAAKKPGVTE